MADRLPGPQHQIVGLGSEARKRHALVVCVAMTILGHGNLDCCFAAGDLLTALVRRRRTAALHGFFSV